MMTELALSYGRRGFGLIKLLLLAFAAQWLLFVPALAFYVTNLVLFKQLPSHGVVPLSGLFDDFLTFSVPAGFLVMLVVRLIQYALFVKPESPARQLFREIKEALIHPAAIINAIPIFVAMMLFNKSMVELKPMIPLIKPFVWDHAFMLLDRDIHFGVDPWRILQPVMGYDYITFVSNIAYDFWFLALFGSWIWFGFKREASELRTRFFFAYMLVWWVGGGLLAVYFSSAGPVYYGRIGLSPDPYTDLFAYLNAVSTRLPLWSLKTQDLLWSGYVTGNDPIGISAFPSMHNASAVLFALMFREISKPVGRFFTAYAVLILATSVHLGWHYAVDGYAAIILAMVCWWVAKPVTRYVHSLTVMKRYNEELTRLSLS